MKTIKDLTQDEIIKMAKKIYEPEHMLVIGKRENWIIEKIEDFICYGDTRNEILEFNDINKFLYFLNSLEYDELINYGLNEMSRFELTAVAINHLNGFFLAIKDNDEKTVEIFSDYDEAVSFVNDERVIIITDENSICNRYAKEYLSAGFMKNLRYERIVERNFFDIEDLIKDYI